MSAVSGMSASRKTWRGVYSEVSRRITEGDWAPGGLIPREIELAEEFGCARATVNRALRELAKEGFLDRRRKAGTRVTKHPVRKATLDISITRLEVEQSGAAYCHSVLSKTQKPAPKPIAAILGETAANPLRIRSLHRADGKPYLYEDRWINADMFPNVLDVDFSALNANEWLVENALLTTGEIIFSAANASKAEAKALDIEYGTAIFIVERTTWNADEVITIVRLAYHPDYKMRTTI